jgi:flagellar basal-body rod protein FlgG
VTISTTGSVQAFIPGQVQPQTVGQINLATFINESGLEAIGDNLFLETPASGQATASTPGSTGFGILRQGYLEVSNVNPVSEITSLITAQRAYEMNSKVIATSDQMLQTTNQLR